MASTIVHRGPDDSGLFEEPGIALAFRRLAILDLSPLGHQPMTSGDGRFTIVFNGEIFNFIELRSELQSLGHSFRSQGDSEVLLTSFIQWGSDCLRRLNGMFAMAIWDTHTRELFLARDRFGIKPLYWTQPSPGTLVFGSEIKALFASGLVEPELDLSRVSDWVSRCYLSDLGDPSATMYVGIRSLDAGHFMRFRIGEPPKAHKWWTLTPHALDIQDPVEEFRHLFSESIRLRLRSDVPLAVSLSGGMDSTAIICEVAAQLGADGEDLLAFSYEDRAFDEGKFIADTINWTGAKRVPVRVDIEATGDRLAEVLYMHDEPWHTIHGVVSDAVYRTAAASGIKVMLGGQGADEYLGGYRPFFSDRWASELLHGRLGTAIEDIRAFQHVQGVGSTKSLLSNAAFRAVIALASQFSLFRSVQNWRRENAEAPLREWMESDFFALRPSPQTLRISDPLTDSLRSNVEIAALPLYLRIEDRNSMTHSIEARLPFLDYRLVQFAFSLDHRWKVDKGLNKVLLREAMRGRIPESVRTRVDKMGFPVELGRWLRGPWRHLAGDLLNSSALQRAGLIRRERVESEFAALVGGDDRNGDAIFTLMQLSLLLKNLDRLRNLSFR